MYAVREIGLTSLVILFLLGQKAGWVPDITGAAHEGIRTAVELTLRSSENNGLKLDRNELHMLRAQNLALETCLRNHKEEPRKCLAIFSSTREQLSH